MTDKALTHAHTVSAFRVSPTSGRMRRLPQTADHRAQWVAARCRKTVSGMWPNLLLLSFWFYMLSSYFIVPHYEIMAETNDCSLNHLEGTMLAKPFLSYVVSLSFACKVKLWKLRDHVENCYSTIWKGLPSPSVWRDGHQHSVQSEALLRREPSCGCIKYENTYKQTFFGKHIPSRKKASILSLKGWRCSSGESLKTTFICFSQTATTSSVLPFNKTF